MHRRRTVLVALGLVHPQRVIRNVGARPDDVLVLTKPLGMGIITTAIKRARFLALVPYSDQHKV